jgi:hypothetical protein
VDRVEVVRIGLLIGSNCNTEYSFNSDVQSTSFLSNRASEYGERRWL